MKSVNNTVSFKEHILKTGTASVQEYSAEHDNYVRKSQLREIWGRFCKNRVALLGLICLLLLIAMALFADVIAPEGYDNQDLYNKFAPPSAEHWFGTDNVGRDIFDRVVHGSRISLTVGMISVSIAAVVGILLGSHAGYYGGRTDNIIMRILDVFMSVPGILLSLSIAAALGPGLFNLMIAVGIGSVPGYARIVRASILSVKEQEYIEAAHCIGCSNARIIFRHVLPNCLAPIIVQATLGVASAILVASSMSFLGLGLEPPIPEWGAMLSVGRPYIRDYWHLVAFPGMAIMITVFSLNVFGDGLRDALDPRLKQ